MVKATISVTKKDDSEVREVLELKEHKVLSIEELIIRQYDYRIDVVDYEIVAIDYMS